MVNRWGNNGNSDRLIFLSSKITADDDCSHEVKRCLLLGRKVMTNLDSIFKSRDITLPTKVYLVIAMVFPVVMYGCESWTWKNAEHWRINAFKLWCWRRLEGPLDWKEIKPVNPKGNKFWLFSGKTDAEAETPILWPPDVKNWLEMTLMLGKIEGRRRGWQRIKWLDGITKSLDMSFSKFWESVMARKAWHAVVHGVTKSWARLSDWRVVIILKAPWPVSTHGMTAPLSTIWGWLQTGTYYIGCWWWT